MLPRRILLTGGAGFIGSHVADGLLRDGHEVAIVDDLSSGREENVPAGSVLHVLDIRSPDAAEIVASGRFDCLIHHAAQMDVRRSVADPGFDAEVNVLGTLNLLQASVAGGVRQVIFASTGGAIYGEQESFPAPEDHPTRPVSPYGVSKLAAERYLYYYHVEHGLDIACLRYANVYGERQSPHGEAGVVAIFLNRMLSGQAPTIHGDGEQTRDYVHVSDVVRANLAVLGSKGFGVYNVGTGVETTVNRLAATLRGTVDGAPEPVYGPAKPGEQRRSSIDPTRLLTEFDLPDPIDLDDGFRRTASWFAARSQSAGTHSVSR